MKTTGGGARGGVAGGEDVGERVAVVDRHQLRAKGVVGRVQREREADRHLGLPSAARSPAPSRPSRSSVRRWVMPMSGSRSQASSTASRVHHRLAHAHEDEVVDRLGAAEVEHLVEDLGGGQIAPEPHLAGRAERAGQRAARLRRDADRAALVAIAHQHRLDRPAVGGAEQRLDGAVARKAPLGERERRERDAASSSRAQLVGRWSSPRSRGRPGRPTPRPAGIGWRVRRARRVSRRAERGSIAPVWWQRHAPRQVPRPRRRRLAPRRGAARVRRARHRRRRGRPRSGARRGRRATTSRSTAAWPRWSASTSSTRSTSPPAT